MLDANSLLVDLRALVAVARKRHAETGICGMPEALATMFHLLDQHIVATGGLPEAWVRPADDGKRS